MNQRQHSEERGQSLVLVAAALVLLVIFVAITVDMSSAYYNRRTAQNAADGAALAGVSRMATGINKKNSRLDDDIKADMNDFAERNGIEDTAGDLADDLNNNVDGWYVDSSGNRLPGEPEVGEQYLDYIPAGAFGIEAITYITAPTYFGGILGFDGYPLQARAVSLIKQACGDDCLIPVITHQSLLPEEDPSPGPGEDLPCYHIWKERVLPSEDVSAGLLGWVNWSWQESVCDGSFPCEKQRPCPSVAQGNGCNAVLLEDNILPDECASGFVEVGDWIAAAPGDMSSSGVRCALDYYLDFQDLSNPCTDDLPHTFTVPVYVTTTVDLGISGASCGVMSDPCNPFDINPTYSLHYKVSGLARMQILQYQLSEGVGAVEYPADDQLTEEQLARINSCESYYDFQCDPDLDPDCEIDDKKKDGFRITVEFVNWVVSFSSSDACFDPDGTLLSSPKLTE